LSPHAIGGKLVATIEKSSPTYQQPNKRRASFAWSRAESCRDVQKPCFFLLLCRALARPRFCIRPEQIQEAIRSGALPVHVIGTKKRVLVESLVAWVKIWKGKRHAAPDSR
jgi:hypothetical protein